ncbi:MULTISPECIES: DASS family sodium-coupled anion symporter [unclassified Arthrobacter]|uniref:SLC13 family permease n=1 Tax=unclassified Arthrobacter TaxID=235627 RepID=UPI001D14DD4C|nr:MULTISPECIES: DASS family sodium-coupled anion symporter [unclassified Arthrobacter]MCC3290148.1 DASS family sodium-coupled anion symporter [Arthrobacter sp. zg-Y1110]MCC3300341.1 DASS family sodium-coupled anion symporter [Arthrobacter sp. zg-Y895]UWX84463.1 DASS family sodium-coupled anion symporter [Arthrobacter sp. zg-Y1110]
MSQNVPLSMPAPKTPGFTDVKAALLGGKTFRSLSEQSLSPREEKFERARQTLGLFLAPAVAIVFALLPTAMDPTQQLLAAVLLGVIILWICEPVPIPVGGLMGVAAVVILGIAPAAEVLQPFGSTTIFTFIGAFILAQAMLKHGIAQRLAFAVLSVPGVAKSTYRIITAFGVITCLLSAFVSNTATVAMLLPTALGILTVIGELLQNRGVVKSDFDPLRLRVGAALMLMLAYGASVGGLLTPVGSPPNLIGRGLIEEATGVRISFAQWAATAAPLCLAMFIVLALVMFLLNKPEIRRIEGVDGFISEKKAEQGKMKRAEVNTLIAFGFTVTLWLLPAFASLIFGTDSGQYIFLDDRLDEGIVAVLGASLLFILPTDWKKREATLTWSDAAKIDWGTIVLFGTGIIFGSLLSATGLAETIGTTASDTLGVTSVITITAFSVILAILISETTSNTASAAVVVPIVIPLCVAMDVDPFIPALAATFAASFGFMLPVSTPQNAIVYGSGTIPITRMIRTGLVFDILGAALIIGIVPIMVGVTGIGG